MDAWISPELELPSNWAVPPRHIVNQQPSGDLLMTLMPDGS
jgi:hypothetical protein